MSRGLVIKSTGKWYFVRDEEGTVWSCRMRGKLRLDGVKSTNPIAVGDHVEFEVEPDMEDKAVISQVLPRKNFIVRKSVNLSRETHIVASNIDQAFLVATLSHPRTSAGFIDRFLVMAEAYDIPVIIVFNKQDLLSAEDQEEVTRTREIYEKIGYKTMMASAETGFNMDAVSKLMSGKVNMFGGHSGVGKSTIINQLDPSLDLKTAAVSDSHQKGKHTTTFAEMFELPNGGYIIDTPGIKGFGVVNIPKEELHHHFPEFFNVLPDCKFHNCTHTNEPGCAVLKAVESGSIAESRYTSYLSMYHQEDGPYR